MTRLGRTDRVTSLLYVFWVSKFKIEIIVFDMKLNLKKKTN